jgi:TPR repeat protein
MSRTAASLVIGAAFAAASGLTLAAQVGTLASPDHSDPGAVGLGDRMMKLLGEAQGAGEVMKLWADYKSGKRAAAGEIYQLARRGNPQAQNLVGYMLDNGDGLKRDSAAAVPFFAAAADQLPLARYNLGLLYLLGRGVPKDERRAVPLLRDAAINASVDRAAVRLCIYYLQQKNDAEAWRWAQEAANRGSVMGFYLLGRILFLKRDYKGSKPWLDKAAAASEPNSPELIAQLYGRGLGIDRSPVLGAGWHLIYLHLNRNTPGTNATATLPYGLTEEEHQSATAFAEKWISTHGTPPKVDYNSTLYGTSR